MLNTIAPKTKNKKPKLVGRGGKRGKTSGRGTKGQKSRAGHKIRPEIRDRIKKLPKLRGRGKNTNKAFRLIPVAVNLSQLNTLFSAGERVTPQTLFAKGIFARVQGQLPKVKILATGTLEKKLSFYDCEVSVAAQKAILASGGTIGGYNETSA